MTHIKICGVADVETVAICDRLRVDLIGLVFADSRRQLTPKQAIKITHHLFTQPKRPKLVGVFVNAPAYEVNQIVKYCRLDLVQLSGDEDDDYCRRIERPLIRATRIGDGTTIEEIESRIVASPPHTVHLLDARSTDKYGGSGECFDWEILGGLNPALPVVVAGGLNPENIGELIMRHRPWGVDVSSGVESYGHKNPVKILAFIKAVRETDTRLKGVQNVAG